MSQKPFSYFQFRTQAVGHVRLICEAGDQDSGRFWLSCIQAVRQQLPQAGQSVLVELIDHHSQPSQRALNLFLSEMENLPHALVVQNSQLAAGLEKTGTRFVLTEDDQQNAATSVNELNLQLSPHQKVVLAGFDGWWIDWLQQSVSGIDWQRIAHDLICEKMASWQDDGRVLIPVRSVQAALRQETSLKDYQQAEELLMSLRDWLRAEDQWLEGIRIDLRMKHFEEAASELESHGGDWADDGRDALEQLFWLRELPSVLLTARPVLCLQAARAARALKLTLQVSYYCNLADLQIHSMRRLARSESDWLAITVNDSGTTISDLIEIRRNLQEGI